MPTPTARRWAAVGALVLGCASAPEEGAAARPSAVIPIGTVEPTGAPVAFRYPNVLGGELTSESLRDRISVLAFITTYDVPSQAEVLFLSRLHKQHTPRINVALIVLEQAENRDIVREFARALEIDYPVAMADAATIRGEGPFAGLHHVPSIVILDREGRERFRHLGPMPFAELDAAVSEAEAHSGIAPK